MGAIATLTPTALHVAPGDEVSATIRVRNAGSVVDEFTFEVLGAAAGWTVVTPAVLRLLPGNEEEATIVMRPPQSADTAAGELPFGIKVNAKEDPLGSVVEEGTVTVAAYAAVTAELLPRTSQGRRRASHELAVDNRGNDRLNADVTAWDDDELLQFEIKEPGLVIDSGQALFTEVEVRPVKRFWRGPEKTLPFNVVVASQDGIAPIQLQGTMVQRPILPKWFWKAVLALLALLLLLVLLWFLVLRPTIESAAADAAEEAASEAAAAAVNEAMAGPIADQQGQIDDLLDKTNELAEEIGSDPIDQRPTTVRAPADFRLSVSANPGGSNTSARAFEAGETFELTDIVFQNPQGTEGLLEIRRGGTTLIAVSLQNFRDLDYHFVVPIVFQEGESLVLAVTCPGDAPSPCAAAAYVSGTLTTPAPEPSG